MALIFERFQTPGIAELSYLVGDDSSGVAAVFDPTPDVEKYVEMARERRLSITHVFETHIHADFVSGSRELCARVGSARIFVSCEGGARYGFDNEPLADGDRFAIGKSTITVRHTPGHTPEHVSYLLAENDREDSPWGVLTGDSLFVGSAGRPDLLGESESEKLAEQQFHTLRDFYLNLADGVTVFPAHGHGSPCGADISDRMQSTIGHERRFNPFLQFEDAESFTKHALESAPPVPTYYPRMKKINARGPEILGNLPCVPGLPPGTFKDALEESGNVLIDTRSMLAFGGGHIAGAINIGREPMLTIWAGWLLEPDESILLVLDADSDLREVTELLLRSGYTKFAGYLTGGMSAWDNAGLPLDKIAQMTVHEVNSSDDPLQIVDVRSPDERAKGHIPGSRHLFLGELRDGLGQLDRELPVATYCASGYRASIAASILKKEGFDHVRNIPGSWLAWKSAGFPIDRA